MREPAFWWQPGAGSFLDPFARLYGVAAALRLNRSGRGVGVPVICLGNLTVGGAGKTPAALAVARLLLAAHERPFFLSRGYGGRLRGPVRVNPAHHSAADVGDEPLLLARLAPTIVARNRIEGAMAAVFAGAGVIVMDDGFQNPSLAKDLAILVVDGRRGIGNGRIIPAGPLRAPLETQIAHAHGLIIVGAPAGAEPVAAVARRRGAAIFHGRLVPDRNVLLALKGRRVLAFAGIGDPHKFFATLSEAGLEVAERAGFPDHHRYTAAEAQALVGRAEAANLVLLTTEKDAARLGGDARVATLAARATALPVRLAIEEEAPFDELIRNAARRSLPHSGRREPRSAE
jgi:tetraacyldisaccharide 4'-kinase